MRKIFGFLVFFLFCFGVNAAAQDIIGGRPVYYQDYFHDNGVVRWPNFADEVIIESSLPYSLFVANVPELRQMINAGAVSNLVSAYNPRAYSFSSEDLRFQQEAGLTKFYYLKTNTKNAQEILGWKRVLEQNLSLRVIPSPVMTTFEHQKINEPLASKQWHLEKLEVQRAFDSHAQSKRIVIIGVGDTGIDPTHEDLPAPILLDGGPDDFFHGTWVASLALSSLNGLGGVGIAPEQVFPNIKLASIKLLERGNASFEDVATGLLRFASWAKQIKEENSDTGIVLNLSIGGVGPPGPLESAIAVLRKVGVVVVAAAGNKNSDISRVPFVPAAVEGVIAVGATNQFDLMAPFSNYGGNTFIAAPGVSMWGAVPKEGVPNRNPNGYGVFDGTSASAPLVSANVALIMWNSDKLPSEDQIKWQLYGRSNFVGELEGRVKTGSRINIGNALAEVADELLSAPVDFTATDSRHAAIWTSFTAPGEIIAHIIHYSTRAFGEENLSNKDIKHLVVTKRFRRGDKVSYVIKDLKELTSYFFRVQVVNTLGRVSPLSHLISWDTHLGDTYTLRTFEKEGRPDPGQWLVIDGPYADAIAELYGTNYQLWHLTRTTVENPSFVWRFGIPDSYTYNLGQPSDAVLLSEIFDLRGLRGASIRMKYFQQLAEPTSKGQPDLVELYAYFPNESNHINIKNSVLLKRFLQFANNTGEEFPFKDLVIDLSEYEGRKVVFGFRFLSMTDRDAFGVVLGNFEVRVDQ